MPLERSHAAVAAKQAGSLTVCGFPLEAGERVLYFVAPTHKGAKIALVVIGVLFAVVLVGIAFLVYAAMYERWALRFVALTDRRLIVRKGNGAPHFMRLDDVVDLRARRPESGGAGGGLVGAAMSAAATIAQHEIQGAQKTDARYWEMTDAVLVQGKKGTLAIDKSADPARLGPAIANALYTEGFREHAPAVVCPP